MRNPTRELTDDPVVLRILEEIKLQGKTEREVQEGLGLAAEAFSRWKYEESKSYMRYIGKIAELLDLTTEYLLDTEEDKVNEASMTGDEIRLVKMFRKISRNKRESVLTVERYLLEIEPENDTEIELYLKKTMIQQLFLKKYNE